MQLESEIALILREEGNRNCSLKSKGVSGIAGDKDMIRKLTQKKDLRSIKRELIASINMVK
ncbi:MAG: hypothetical protein BGO14_11235 [Chlamydiales bacterium 38-26]|nr:MAG: hypothetical protein BGO14_11235 [Chlamydiales bacterium 38-26]